ncbi:MAG: geranylgeranylglycerol-phosphate geranylgeranyltransferase [Flavobacteriales bacterium]
MSFLRLIRISNLFIIAFTMYGVWYTQTHDKIPSIEFNLLVLFTVLVAGAGNAINDYFDVKSDRINKPEKVVVEKRIKRRWAIIIHWAFNAAALGLSIFLSWRLSSWFYIFIHFFSTSLLWVYSVYLKPQLFWSNFSISFLVGIVPLISLKATHDLGYPLHHLTPLLLIASFAFVINFSREIIKDIQDMEGDTLRSVRSFPLVYGAEKARWIATSVTLLLIPLYLVGLYTSAFPSGWEFNILFTSALLLSMSILILQLLNAREQSMNLLLKLSLLLGSISIYFL